MGFFDWLRGHKGTLPASPVSALTMVMLRSTESFSLPRIQERIAASRELARTIHDWGDTDAVATASIPGGVLGLVVVPAPIPAPDLEGPTLLAWHWPDAAAQIAQHSAHAIVHLNSTALSAIEAHLLLTRVVGLIVAETDAVGVYIGSALLVRPGTEYAADAATASADNLPLLSWMGFQIAREESGLSAYTTGLATFGLRELEIRRSALAPSDLVGTLMDLVSYQLTSGRVIGDGDTFGATPEERTRVRFTRSEFIPDTDVALIELDAGGLSRS